MRERKGWSTTKVSPEVGGRGIGQIVEDEGNVMQLLVCALRSEGPRIRPLNRGSQANKDRALQQPVNPPDARTLLVPRIRRPASARIERLRDTRLMGPRRAAPLRARDAVPELAVQRAQDVADGDAARVAHLDRPLAVREETAGDAEDGDGRGGRVLGGDGGGETSVALGRETRVLGWVAQVVEEGWVDVVPMRALCAECESVVQEELRHRVVEVWAEVSSEEYYGGGWRWNEVF